MNLNLNWQAAHEHCRNQGMDLMTLETEQKQKRIDQLFPDTEGVGKSDGIIELRLYANSQQQIYS